MPFCHEWDEAKAIPNDLFIKTAKAGFQGAIVGHVEPNLLPYGLPAGIKPSEWDNFHALIVTDEIARCGSGGVRIFFKKNYLPSNLYSYIEIASLGIMRRVSYWPSSSFTFWFSIP